MQSKPRLELNKEFSTMSDLGKAWKCSSLPGLGLASIVLMHLQKMFLYSICPPITIFGQVPYITHSYNCLLAFSCLSCEIWGYLRTGLSNSCWISAKTDTIPLHKSEPFFIQWIIWNLPWVLNKEWIWMSLTD